MATTVCECLCSYNHPDRLGICTGHGYRHRVVGPATVGDVPPQLCPKCRAALGSATLGRLEVRAAV